MPTVYWTREEKKFLADNWLTMSATEIGRRLGKSEPGVRQQVKHLGLPNKRSRKVWTKEEDLLLAELVRSRSSIQEIAAVFGRSEVSVRLRSSKKLKAFRSDKHLRKNFGGKSFYHGLKCSIMRGSSGAKCCLCEYSKHIDLHHIDGNRLNNDRLNIASLCPNHHREVEADQYEGEVLFCVWWRVYSDGSRSEVFSTLEEQLASQDSGSHTLAA